MSRSPSFDIFSMRVLFLGGVQERLIPLHTVQRSGMAMTYGGFPTLTGQLIATVSSDPRF